MSRFNGFPARMDFTPVPNIFFSALLPEIDDIAELKTTLYIIKTLYNQKGHLRFVTGGELEGNTSLLKSLKGEGKSPAAVVQQALAQAVGRGTLLRLSVESNGVAENIYLLNTEANRQNLTKIQDGEIVLEGITTREQPPVVLLEEPPDIFTQYEQNIGVLTPMLAEQLREAVKLYPQDWIKDAIKEAVSLNKRNWRYIERILEKWTAEGKGDGKHKRHPSWDTDPDKYIKGPYGHMVQR